MSETVIILSGGMDSAVLAAERHHQGDTLYALSFDYGSKHAAKELACARELASKYCKTHAMIRLGFVGELLTSALLEDGEQIPKGHYEDESMKKTVVPFRNGIMLSIAVGYAENIGAKAVLIGSHAGDHAIYPDCRPEFTTAICVAAVKGTYGEVEVLAPFSKWTKRTIGLHGRELGVDFAGTWTCYVGSKHHCGECGACTERKEALEGFDPTVYNDVADMPAH